MLPTLARFLFRLSRTSMLFFSLFVRSGREPSTLLNLVNNPSTSAFTPSAVSLLMCNQRKNLLHQCDIYHHYKNRALWRLEECPIDPQKDHSIQPQNLFLFCLTTVPRSQETVRKLVRVQEKCSILIQTAFDVHSLFYTLYRSCSCELF